MSNVLTYEAKKRLDTRAGVRFLVVGAVASIVSACGATLALAPAFIHARIARAALERPSQAAEEAREDSVQASRAQVLVSALHPMVGTTTPTDVLAGALASQPSDISITSITYQSNPEQLMLSGRSDSRESVDAFRSALVASGRFSKVDVPVAALAGVQEGRFTMTLSGPF